MSERVEISVEDARLILEAYESWDHKNEREYALAIDRLRKEVEREGDK